MNDRIFKTQGDVLDYLHKLGVKISRAKLSKDYRSGLLHCQPDKTFLENDVASYAESLRAPAFHPEKVADNKQAQQLLHLKKMIIDFCTAIPDFTSLYTVLGTWLDKGNIDPEIARKIASCQKRVATQITKRQEDRVISASKSENGKAVQTEKEEQASTSPIANDCSFINLYRRHRSMLKPDQIKLPEIPGGYDTLDKFDPHARFCLTGVFAYGERGDCEKLVRRLGGKVAKHPVLYEQTYIVVGTLAAPDWSYGFYGNKIELGLKYRSHGGAVKIITEDNWIELVLAYQNNS